MHFWIDKRSTGYGRRRPGVLYTSGIRGAHNQRNKILRIEELRNGQGSSSFPHNSTTMVTPVHRFQPMESIREGDRCGSAGATGRSGSHSASLGTMETRSQGSPAAGRSNPPSRNNSRERRDRHRGRAAAARRTPITQTTSANSGISSATEIQQSSDVEIHLSGSRNSFEDSDEIYNRLYHDPKWTRTKRIGLTLCFMAFILICTVAAKFVIEGPGIIDTTRRGQTEATIYFFFTELIIVGFAFGFFLVGVTCLRKRTQDYLAREYQHHITTTSRNGEGSSFSSSPNGVTGDFMEEDQEPQPHGFTCLAEPPHLPHSHRSRRNVPFTFNHVSHARSCVAQRQQPPPYHVALYLPVPKEEDWMTPEEMAVRSLIPQPLNAEREERPETPPPQYDESESKFKV